MSKEEKQKPVIDEDNQDTDTIIEEKTPSKESTGGREDYQHVVDKQTGAETGKVITPDGRVLTEQPITAPRVVTPGALAGKGGISVDFPDISIDVGDIHAPDLNITEPLLNLNIPEPLMNINIPQPLVDIDVSEPIMNIDIPQPLVDIDVSEPIMNIDIPQPLVDIKGPLIDIPPFPEWPAIPDNLVNIEGPLVSLPEEELIKIIGPLITLPEIPENLVNIVGPMVELPEWPEEGLVNVGDITMPEVVGIDIPLDEIPPTVQYGIAGGLLLLGLGSLLLGIGKTASAVKGFTKEIAS